MNSTPTGAVTRLAPISSMLAAAVLALLLGLQPVMTDVYLPALPALGPELGAHRQRPHRAGPIARPLPRQGRRQKPYAPGL